VHSVAFLRANECAAIASTVKQIYKGFRVKLIERGRNGRLITARVAFHCNIASGDANLRDKFVRCCLISSILINYVLSYQYINHYVFRKFAQVERFSIFCLSLSLVVLHAARKTHKVRACRALNNNVINSTTHRLSLNTNVSAFRTRLFSTIFCRKKIVSTQSNMSRTTLATLMSTLSG